MRKSFKKKGYENTMLDKFTRAYARIIKEDLDEESIELSNQAKAKLDELNARYAGKTIMSPSYAEGSLYENMRTITEIKPGIAPNGGCYLTVCTKEKDGSPSDERDMEEHWLYPSKYDGEDLWLEGLEDLEDIMKYWSSSKV